MGHLETAMSQMDAGTQSPEYRESLEFLRRHADEVTRELEGALLEAPGSFRKWQLTYMLGELGDEPAIGLLRAMLDRPLPPPASPRAEEHEIDLRYTEELTSRIQAVISTARIAAHRPELRDPVVTSLLEMRREVPMATATAEFELQKLLGPELGRILDALEAKRFHGFAPSPDWQARLSQRIAEEDRQRRALREKRGPLCRRD